VARARTRGLIHAVAEQEGRALSQSHPGPPQTGLSSQRRRGRRQGACACREILNDWDAITAFVANPDLPPTNNDAETALRHAVICKAISFGTRTDEGSRAYAAILSVIETCRRRKLDAWSYITNAVATARKSGLLATLPAATNPGGERLHTDSFADEEYYGVNAFIFVNEKGERHAVRYVMAPERLVHLSAEEAAKQAQDFLIDELPARLSRGPVTFRLKAQLAGPGDSTKDASIPWPESNETIELGMLTITKSTSDSLEVTETLLFLPGQLIDGIEPSDDLSIGGPRWAYAVSLSRRTP